MVIFFKRCDGNVFSSGHHCQRWFFNGFATPWPSPLNVFLQIDHWHRWFFNGFSQIQVRWLTMVLVMKKPKKRVNATYHILWKICLEDTTVHTLSTNLFVWTVQWNNFLLRFIVGFCSCWTFEFSFCYHWKFAMVFRGTITIEWNGQRQPLKTMVFRWFWVSQPLVTMVFRWLATIGPTMEWLHTIVEV